MKLQIEIGSRYGMLQVLQEADRILLPCGQKNRAFLCRCECGNETVVRVVHLTRGRTLSCGSCLKREPGDDHIYNVWRGMKGRCYWDKTIQPHLYKDKGITVCDEWRYNFPKFKLWAYNNGYSRELQIDRIDNSDGYYPENCRWVTPIENANNKDCTFFIVYKGVRRALALVLREVGKMDKYNSIMARIKRGWTADKAIDTPIRTGKYFWHAEKLAKQKGQTI